MPLAPALAARALDDHTRSAYRAAGQVIGSYSTSFSAATRLLAEPVRRRVRAVYAMVRTADEIVDGAAAGAGLGTPEVGALLDAYEAGCEHALQVGYSPDPVLHAFAHAARATGITAELTRPFFAAMRSDLVPSRHDEESLPEYVHGSAEVVGLMCLRVFATDRSPEPVDPPLHLEHGARRLGAAFQQVNFLRDLEADVDDRGRAYLPGTDGPSYDATRRDRVVAGIRDDLHAARVVIPELPRSSRVAVGAAHDLFAELTERLAAVPAADLRERRVRVPDARKAVVLGRAVVRWGR
ncbi:phytoene/squalene synthase family protein [Kytococcus sp. Marseille-QA3725]